MVSKTWLTVVGIDPVGQPGRRLEVLHFSTPRYIRQLYSKMGSLQVMPANIVPVPRARTGPHV